MNQRKHGSIVLAVLAAGIMAGCGGAGPGASEPEGSAQPAPAAAVTLNPPDTYVNLFKWRWTDIATECTKFLGPQGIGGVQISPPAEHKNVNAWWNIYQPVNHHNLTSDMGTPAQLQAMINTCHAAGVRIYADVVFNQLSADSGTGVGGSSFNAGSLSYPYFGSSDFHSKCDIDYSSEANTTACWLLGMPDLNTGSSYVQGQFTAYLNSLIAMGVDGFRIDAAKHILPSELQAVIGAATQTTLLGEQVFITHEVIEDQSWINLNGYMASGTVNEFRFARAIRDAIRNNALASVTSYSGTGSGGGSYNLISNSAKATVFVDNHDTQRSTGDSLNYTTDSGGKYDLGVIYMLGQPYGRAQLQSGYAFSYSNTDENAPTASPYDASGNPIITTSCSNTSAACGWDFVHRWSTVYPMVKFRSAVSGTAMTVVSTGSGNQLAFRRGNVGFVALNNATSSWSATFATGLPQGTYCNVVHGLLSADGTACTSDSVTVDASGNATLTVGARGGSSISAVALYTGQKVNGGTSIPAAPTGLSATASGTTVNLAWTASSGATSYTIYRSTSATSGFASVGTSTSASFASTGLTRGTTYYFYVTASNTAGTSGASATVSATVPLYVSNYGAMYHRGSFNSWGATAMTLSGDNTWTVTVSLTAGTSYQYKYEIAGGSTWSTNWGLGTSDTSSKTSGTAVLNGSYNIYFTPSTTGAHTFTFNDSSYAFTVTGPSGGTAPAAPTGLSATPAGTTVALSWTASSGATSYTVYRSTSATTGFASVGTSTTTSYSNAGLAAATTYYYYVTASNSAGTSPASSTVSATTGSAPLAPTGLTATPSGTTINLSWTASSGATAYTVYRSTSATSGFVSVGTPTATSYSDTGLAATTTYYYYVTATNSVGTSPASPTVNATTGGGGTVTTTIRVHFDVGYGNTISIRGSLSPLSWTAGLAATWTTGNIWVWSTTAIASGASFEYKPLRNDSGWSDGSNYVGTGGATLDIYPTFNGNFYDVMDTISTNWTVSGGTSTAKWVQGTLDSSGVAKCTNCSTESVLTQTNAMSKTGTTVTLGFKYSTTGLTSTEYLKVDVLKGTTWTTVGTFTGTVAATNKAIDISAYQSTAMKLRFRAKMSGSTKVVTVDNVTVSVK